MMTNGLVHALQLDQQGGAKEFPDLQSIPTLSPQEFPLWLHFDYTDQQAQAWIAEHSGLDAVLSDALLALETRPRVTVSRDGLLIYLRGVNLNPGAAPEDMIAIRLVVQRNRIISTQRRGLASVRDILGELKSGQGPQSVGGLVAELVDRLTWYMDDVIERLEADLQALEESRVKDPRERMVQIGSLRRRIITLRRYFAPQRDALLRMLQLEQSEIFSDAHRVVIREAVERLQRLMEDLDMFRDHATLAQEEVQGETADQLNQRMYVLSIITGLFLPLGFLTGLFGINLGGMPGAESQFGFAWFVGILAVVLAICSVLLYRRRWF